MAAGDTRTEHFLDVLAHGSRADIPQENCCNTKTQNYILGAINRIIDVEEEVEWLENNPDVADIVATYAALQAYDTSSLTDKDIIRVLSDETHEGQSTYYRYDKSDDSWDFIGTIGDYYTKTQLDTILEGKQDVLTAGENITIAEESGALVISATGGGASYTAGDGIDITGTTISVDTDTIQPKLTAGSNITISDNTISATDTTYSNFTGTDGTAAGTAGLVPAPATTDAGKFLKADGTWDTAGGGSGVVELTSADYNYDYGSTGSNNRVALWLLKPGVYVAKNGVAISANNYAYGHITTGGTWIVGEYGSGTGSNRLGIIYFDSSNTDASNSRVYVTDSLGGNAGSGKLVTTPVQSTGTSTTDVMSQNAVTSMVFADPDTKRKVQIGASAAARGASSTVIGAGALAASLCSDSVAIGTSAILQPEDGVTTQGQVAIGHGASSYANYSVAIGKGAKATVKGQFDISTQATTNTNGYNNSQYRLLTGLYDPQSAHDAATKGYVDGLVGNVASALNVINNGTGA